MKRKVLLAIVASQVVAVLVAITMNVATGVIPASWHPYLWIAWPVLGVLVTVGVVLAVATSREGGGEADRISAQRAEYSRRSMVSAVREMWIDGVLAHSVHRQVLIELGMEYRPDMLRDPWDLLVERPGQQARPLEPDTTVTDVLQQHRGLLIIGAPGAGKTTVLLGVLEQLLAAAEQDAVAPIPVVFPLTTWASSGLPLAEWLVNGLCGPLYGVSRAVAEYWITQERVLPLLDGLDEVALDKRMDCARAIETFHAEHRLLPLVVTSRLADYNALGLKLALGAALLIHPLTPAQVERHLEHWGEPLAGLRAAVRDDPSLWDLLQTPFLLSVAVSTYEGLPAPDIGCADSLEQRRKQLLGAFIRQTLGRKRPQSYRAQDAVRWLSYIARALGRRLETVYYLEFVDADWLPRPQRLTVVAAVSALAGVLSGTMTGLLMKLFFGAWPGLAVGVLTGIVFFGFRMGLGEVNLPHADRGRVARLAGAVAVWGCLTPVAAVLLGLLGGFLGLITGVIAGAASGASVADALTSGAAIGAVAGALIALPVVTAAGPLDRDRNSLRDRPAGADLYDAAWLSCALAVVFGIPAVWVLGAIYGLAGALTGATVALSAGYLYSGAGLLGYWLTRIWLVRAGLVPQRQADFLAFAAQRMLILRVGGGYMFTHRLLLEFFAQIEPVGRPERYASDGLPVIDLRPDMVLARALADARDGQTGVIRELTYVGTLLPAEVWVPAAMEIATIMARGLMSSPRLRGSLVKEERLRTASAVLRLVMSAEHADFSPAAAFNLGELITVFPERNLPATVASETGFSREEALAAYQMAVDSGHPEYSARAAARLAQLRTL
jgi:hypothetical protein